MTGKKASTTAQLLRASFDDEVTLALALPDSAFGFHARQAVENLYKALLAEQAGTYPFSHDLLSLRLRLERSGFELPVCAFRLEELSEYAGDARYGDPLVVDEETRASIRECIAKLREYVLTRVQVE